MDCEGDYYAKRMFAAIAAMFALLALISLFSAWFILPWTLAASATIWYTGKMNHAYKAELERTKG